MCVCACDAVTFTVCVCSQRLPEERGVLGSDEGAEQSCISLPEGLGPGPQLPGE